MAKRRLHAHLEVETEAGAVLGGTRIRLLEAIDKFGSISKAAQRVPMSYKAAWDALDDLNNLADFPVIDRIIGGVGGGGTKLTDYGRKLVAMFRAVEDEYQAAMDHLHNETASSSVEDKAAFQRLLRRITLRTSARNQFSCTVSRIVEGPVSAQVFLALDDDCELEAQITSDSVRHLGLSAGREVIALVKAPAVFLLSDPDTRTSVSNHLSGIVSRIHQGSVNAEVVVDLSLTRTRHVTSVVTTQAVAALGLKVGSTVTAAFQATSVILTTFG
jgi:molybdate transport system regulatory protein